MDKDDPTLPEQTAQAPDAGLACNCCRKRKLRCSRETPIYEHCRKTGQDCVYETKRARPGMKGGAIENVHKRLGAIELENLRVKEASTTRASSQQEAVDRQSLLSSLAREICKLGNSTLTASPEASIDSTCKRRRTEEHVGYREGSQYAVNQPGLPDDVILDLVIDAYFRQIHPWIPMIHEARFRQRRQDHGDDRCLLPVLQAMMLSASYHVPRRDIAEIAQSLIGDQEAVRDWVVSKATKSLTVENLQALIIICFRDIGDREESRAWSLIGALTCWNTSLTSDDLNCRLPCDGISWRKEESVSTPYFGIWDKSAARIGNPIAFLPSHSATVPATTDEGGLTLSEATTSPGAAASSVDMSTVGAFAYCIEATESLSRGWI
ncbi:related to C6 transcription factor [Fusarium fujikuroi]|nr:related to C6 transcription factor [Fusarium fujikuroi]